ncbi:MAG: autotransporter domain-containing protein [Methylococcaceae bacterium]|nr:autotransporter domain-containing protein [Methylococcaceae bacterium]
MLNQLRIVSMLIFCCLSIKAAKALDFNGSTVISSDVNDGLNAIGGVEGDTLLIESGVTITIPVFTTNPIFWAVDLNNFPFEVTNNGTIKSGSTGIYFNNTGTVFNRGSIFYGSTGIFSPGEVKVINSGIISGGIGSGIHIHSGEVINSGVISHDINIFGEKGTIINSGTISRGVNLSSGGVLTNSGAISGDIFISEGGKITNSGTIFDEHANFIEIFGGGMITNSGLIHGEIINSVSLSGSGMITNTGIISGGEISNNIILSEGGIINNSGSISGKNNSIKLSGDGIISNSGSIAREESNISLLGKGVITNSGTISGGHSRIQLSGEGQITNSGTISVEFGNDISLFGGGIITNNGLISGDNASFIRLDKGGKIINTGSVINSNSVHNSSILMLDGGELSNSGDLTNLHIEIRDGGVVTNSGNISCSKINCNTSTIAISNGGTLINSGTIIGNRTAIEISGDSKVINSGTISTSANGIAIATFDGDDTVILQTDSIVEGDIDGGSNTLVVGGDMDKAILQGKGTFNNDFQNFENLTMEGTNWNLTGNSIFNDTLISNGLLRINGTHASPIIIQTDGLLGGSGVIVGNVRNSGTVTPGNSIGTTTINGDYIHEPNANLVIEFDNNNSDQLIVIGNTALNGGSLTLIPLELVRTSQAFTFLQSGTITGQFDEILKPVVFDIATFQEGNKFSLVGRNSYASLAATSNQTTIGSSLQGNLSAATGDLQTIMLELDSILTKDEFRSALDQLSPEPLAALPMVTFTGSQLYAGTIAKHLRGLQMRSSKMNQLQQSVSLLAFGGSPESYLYPTSHSALADNSFDTFTSNGWQTYVQPYGVFSRLESDQGFTGFNANTGGISVGVDRQVSDSLIMGANVGWSYTDIDWDRSSTQARIQAGRVAGYWGFQKSNWDLNGIVSYGYNYYESERKISFGSINRVAESDHDGHEFSFYLNSAYSFQYQNWRYGPVASIQYIGLFEDDYNETGAGAAGFMIDNNSTHSLRSTLGIHAALELEWDDDKVIIPELEIGWAHEILDNEYTVNAQFQNSAGGSFNIRGRDLGNNSAYVGASITATLSKNTLIKLNYNADIGREDYVNHMANFMMIVQF